jgi:hypothetical protein
MTITLETYLLVSLAFAVFAAVVAVGSSLVLGASFERLKISFEVIQKQTGFFSDALFRMEHRVETLEEQTDDVAQEEQSAPVYITAEEHNEDQTLQSKSNLWNTAELEGVRFH